MHNYDYSSITNWATILLGAPNPWAMDKHTAAAPAIVLQHILWAEKSVG